MTMRQLGTSWPVWTPRERREILPENRHVRILRELQSTGSRQCRPHRGLAGIKTGDAWARPHKNRRRASRSREMRDHDSSECKAQRVSTEEGPKRREVDGRTLAAVRCRWNGGPDWPRTAPMMPEANAETNSPRRFRSEVEIAEAVDGNGRSR
jgi:hypothetical protein